eukprot:scaffold8365_cov108-Isochrysis_galbana.AAC.1
MPKCVLRVHSHSPQRRLGLTELQRQTHVVVNSEHKRVNDGQQWTTRRPALPPAKPKLSRDSAGAGVPRRKGGRRCEREQAERDDSQLLSMRAAEAGGALGDTDHEPQQPQQQEEAFDAHHHQPEGRDWRVEQPTPVRVVGAAAREWGGAAVAPVAGCPAALRVSSEHAGLLATAERVEQPLDVAERVQVAEQGGTGRRGGHGRGGGARRIGRGGPGTGGGGNGGRAGVRADRVGHTALRRLRGSGPLGKGRKKHRLHRCGNDRLGKRRGQHRGVRGGARGEGRLWQGEGRRKIVAGRGVKEACGGAREAACATEGGTPPTPPQARTKGGMAGAARGDASGQMQPGERGSSCWLSAGASPLPLSPPPYGLVGEPKPGAERKRGREQQRQQRPHALREGLRQQSNTGGGGPRPRALQHQPAEAQAERGGKPVVQAMIQQNQLHPSLPTGLATGVHTGIHAGIHAGLHIGLHTGIHTGIHTGLRPVACAQVDVSRVRISMHQPMAEWQLTHQHVGHKRRRRARVGACPPQLIVPCIDTQQPLDPLSGQQATGAKQHTRDEHVRTPVATAAAPAATIPAATSALADSAIAARAPSSERGPGGIRVGGLCQKVQLGSDVRLQVSHHPPNVEAAGLQHGGHHPEDLE